MITIGMNVKHISTSRDGHTIGLPYPYTKRSGSKSTAIMVRWNDGRTAPVDINAIKES